VFFIGPETKDNAMKMMDKTRATIPLLYDLDGSVMKAYGVAFEIPDYQKRGYEVTAGIPDANPDTGYQLPIPATYVVDTGGIIRAAYVNPDYTRRMEPSDIVAALKELAG
jgi:peroxiredoxin